MLFHHIHSLGMSKVQTFSYITVMLWLCYLAAAKSRQLCLTLCDPIDGSPPGSRSLGFSRQEHWSQCMKVKVKPLSHVRLFSTPWTAAYQAPPSMGLPRQEYWSGLPLLSPALHYAASTDRLLPCP